MAKHLILLLLLLSACAPAGQTPTLSPAPTLSSPASPGLLSSPSPSPAFLNPPTSPPTPLPSPSPLPTPSPDPLSPALQLSYTPWDPVLAQAWSPGGDILAVAAGTRVHLYQYPGFSLLRSIQLAAWVGGMDFYPGPSGEPILALVLKNGELQFWDAGSAGLICSLQAHPRSGNSLAFAPGSSILATAGSDPMVRLWETEALVNEKSCELEPYAELIGSSFSVPWLQFSPSGDVLASVDGRAIRLREVATERLAGVLRAGEPVFNIDYHPSAQILAAAEIGEKVRLWDLTKKEEIGILTAPDPLPDHFIWQIVFSPSGRFAAGGSSRGSVYLWDTRDPQRWSEPIVYSAGTRGISSVSFTPDETLLLAGSLDGILTAWKVPPP